MEIGWSQKFSAMWTLKGKSEIAKYDVSIIIEGPERKFMSDAGPIIQEISKLEGANLSSKIGRSSLEAVVIYVRDLVQSFLEKDDIVKKVKILENDMFYSEV